MDVVANRRVFFILVMSFRPLGPLLGQSSGFGGEDENFSDFKSIGSWPRMLGGAIYQRETKDTPTPPSPDLQCTSSQTWRTLIIKTQTKPKALIKGAITSDTNQNICVDGNAISHIVADLQFR